MHVAFDMIGTEWHVDSWSCMQQLPYHQANLILFIPRKLAPFQSPKDLRERARGSNRKCNTGPIECAAQGTARRRVHVTWTRSHQPTRARPFPVHLKSSSTDGFAPGSQLPSRPSCSQLPLPPLLLLAAGCTKTKKENQGCRLAQFLAISRCFFLSNWLDVCCPFSSGPV
jgi:hypothetical protein